MIDLQPCTYVHNWMNCGHMLTLEVVMVISPQLTSSPQIRAYLSPLSCSCGNHGIRLDDCLLPKRADQLAHSLRAWCGRLLLQAYVIPLLNTSRTKDYALGIVRGICSICDRSLLRYYLGGCPLVWSGVLHICQTSPYYDNQGKNNVLRVDRA